MRLTERKTTYPECDKQGNLTKVDYIEIKDKKLAEEKLCQLEDIEEELGIDLNTLFKAMQKGVYVKEAHLPKNPIRFISNNCLVFDDEYIYELKYCKGYTKLTEHSYPFYLKDYGKTWSLVKEDLEDK